MKLLCVTVALMVVLFAPANSYACFVITDDFPNAFEKAKAVFIGEVTEIKKPVSLDPNAPLADRWFRVSFKVKYSWKGAGFQEFGIPNVIVLADQERDCFSWGSFIEGREYLVFADKSPQKDLVLRLGNRTASVRNASDDLKELDRMFNPFYRFQIGRAKRPF